MSTINTGGQAFPRPVSQHNPTLQGAPNEAQSGMTMRDYFAAKVISGMAANPDNKGLESYDAVIKAYRIADMMIEKRDK